MGVLIPHNKPILKLSFSEASDSGSMLCHGISYVSISFSLGQKHFEASNINLSSIKVTNQDLKSWVTRKYSRVNGYTTSAPHHHPQSLLSHTFLQVLLIYVLQFGAIYFTSSQNRASISLLGPSWVLPLVIGLEASEKAGLPLQGHMYHLWGTCPRWRLSRFSKYRKPSSRFRRSRGLRFSGFFIKCPQVSSEGTVTTSIKGPDLI